MPPVNTPLAEPPEVDESLTIEENGLSQPVSEPLRMIVDDHEEEVATTQRQTEVSHAFGVPVFHWKDLPLAPFAISREGDWMRHRELLGSDPLEEIISNPRAMLPDAIRVLWFCAVDPAEWLTIPSMKMEDGFWQRLTGQERALLLEAKIRTWGEEHVLRTDAKLAVDTFYDIYQSTQSTRAVAKPSEHHREDNEKK